ncbi:MAG: PEP/pyruvate-binding domain-containing protein [Desulfomonilaceae bacterium]
MLEAISNIVNKIKGWKSFARPHKTWVSRVSKFKYASFKDLLASYTELLNIIADIEEKLRGQDIFGMSYVRSQSTRAVFHTLRMLKSLDDLSGHRYLALFEVLEGINKAIEEEISNRKELSVCEWVVPYSRITRDMVDWVGGKNANVGELANTAGLAIPEGFAITSCAYDFFIEQNAIGDEISRMRRNLDPHDTKALNTVSEQMQRLIMYARVPEELEEAILSAYDDMVVAIREKGGEPKSLPSVAIRSLAVGEDGEHFHSGQYGSIFNVQRDRIVQTYKDVLAGLYIPQAISYRLNRGVRDEDLDMTVGCIEMVQSVCSGVVYSWNASDSSSDTILVNAVWGLGPCAPDEIVRPGSYVVAKDHDLTIVRTTSSHQSVQLIADEGGGLSECLVDADKQDTPCLSPEQVKTLAGHAATLEKHYEYPQEIDWALDSLGRLLVLQTRPVLLESLEKESLKRYPPVEGHSVLVEAEAVAFQGVGSGPAFHVRSDEDLAHFPAGAVLIAKHSSPQFVVAMQKAQAIVTDTGSVTGHMASLAKEFGVPTLLNAKNASTVIAQGTEVTVDAYSGRVYQGPVPELIAKQKSRASVMKDTPVWRTLRRVADRIVPLHLMDPKAADFSPKSCKTLRDIMWLVHELSYNEMFRISDIVSDTIGAGAMRLKAPIRLDLHIIDLGGGLTGTSAATRWVTADQVTSIPLRAVLQGLMHEDLLNRVPRPLNLGGLLSVMREQMLAPIDPAGRFGERSYALVSDRYLNFSSRIGYHYTFLDAYAGQTADKNYIAFTFKGGATDDVRRSRRTRAIAAIFHAFDFSVEVREDRLDARFSGYELPLIEARLDMVGRLLQFTRQVDMLMQCEDAVDVLCKSFLNKNYDLDGEVLCSTQASTAD